MTGQATDIYQAYLDASTRLVISGEAEAFCDHVQLPLIYRTGRGVEVIETASDLAADVRKAYLWQQDQDVTDYHRIARSGRFLDEDTIEGFHVTYMLRGAVAVVEPYASRAILRRTDGRWRISYAEHELADAPYHGRNAKAQHGLFSAMWERAPSPIRQNQCSAIDIYTSRITSFAEAASAADFDAWLDHYTLPHSVHYDSADRQVEHRDDARFFFDMLQNTFRQTGANTFSAEPISAVFVSDDRLLGYHNATLTLDGQVRFGPLRSRMVWVLHEGQWRCNSVANALSTAAFQSCAFEPSPILPTMREIQKRMKK